VIRQKGIGEYIGLPICALSVAAAAVHLSAYQTMRGTAFKRSLSLAPEHTPTARRPQPCICVAKIRQFTMPSNTCQCFELASQVSARISDSHVFPGVSAASAGLDPPSLLICSAISGVGIGDVKDMMDEDSYSSGNICDMARALLIM
jgi:hypothetical protein